MLRQIASKIRPQTLSQERLERKLDEQDREPGNHGAKPPTLACAAATSKLVSQAYPYEKREKTNRAVPPPPRRLLLTEYFVAAAPNDASLRTRKSRQPRNLRICE